MTYPHDPAGLNWAEHYELSDKLFDALVAALAEGRPRTKVRAETDPKPETATRRKHVKTTKETR